MSTEDDIARVNEVTDAIAGPLKVWVLEITPDGQDSKMTLHYTFEGATARVRLDLESSFRHVIDIATVEAALAKFSPTGYLDTHNTVYCAYQQEIME